MTRPAERRPRGGAKARLREVRDRLAEHGFAAGPFRLWRGPGAGPAEARGPRLRAALARLGPAFTGFGAYLATRVDLGLGGLRAGLSAPFPRPAAAPAAAVRELLARELGRAPAFAFTEFEEAPCAAGLLYQAHRARLLDGEPVTVKVALPGREDELAAELAALPLLEKALAEDEGAALDLGAAVADYRHLVRQQADFRHEAHVLEALARDGADCELLRAPRVFAGLSTARVLTVERLPGRPLAELLPPGGAPAAGADGRGLADRLCAVWLRQAALGRFFPVETGPDDVLVLPGGELAFTGACASAPAAAQRDLWEYLLAAAADDPDRACAHLARTLERGPGAEEDGLRHRFRQAVPFRDGGPGGAAETLGGLLRLHRDFARAAGYRTPGYLSRWYRGLFLVHDAARRLAPGHDALRDGLENVQVAATLGRFRELLTPAHWERCVAEYAPVLRQLPGDLDGVLTLLAEGDARLRLRLHEPGERRRERNTAAVLTSVLLALAGVGALTQHLESVGALGGWGGRAGAGVFLLGGALLLWGLGRGA
jgi:predicted unusual protein kinase regulating ubiquinone biosynthesis (AarF/ABC1/UbiB family)